MSNIGSYKNTAFTEQQKFLVLDPATGSTSLVAGSSLVDYITPNLNYVRAETTRTAAENTDYEIGVVVQTIGATSTTDGLGAVYLVVEGGTGDFPMLNGNDLLLVAGDDTLREDLASTDPGDGASLVSFESGATVQDLESDASGQGASLVSMEGGPSVEVAVNQRVKFADGVAALGALSVPDLAEVSVTGFWAGTSVGAANYQWQASRAKTEHDGVTIIDPDKTSELGSIGAYGSYFTPAVSGSGCFVILGQATVYNAGAIDDASADNATAITNAIAVGAVGAADELFVSGPVVLPTSRVYFNNLKITASGSFVGSYIIDTTNGLNFEDLHVSANGQDISLLDRDDTVELSSGYFRNFTASDTPATDATTGITFRGVNNLDGKGLTLLGVNQRDACRVRGCDNGEVIGIMSRDCGARSLTISNGSNNFFFRQIVILTEVQNTGAADGGSHLYVSGEVGPTLENCGFSDLYIRSETTERNLVKFSRDSRNCSLVNAYGTVRGGTGFNGILSAQGSPNSLFRNIDLLDLQTDTSGTASLIFCRPHPATGTQSSGSDFIDIRIRGSVAGVQLDASDTGGAAGTISNIVFKNVFLSTQITAFTFNGGSYTDILVKDSEFFASGGRALNTDYSNMGTVTNVVFDNVVAKTEIASEAARFPSGTQRIHHCAFERPHTAGQDVVRAQTGDGLVTHNLFKGGSVLYSGTGTLAGNFNVVDDS